MYIVLRPTGSCGTNLRSEPLQSSSIDETDEDECFKEKTTDSSSPSELTTDEPSANNTEKIND